MKMCYVVRVNRPLNPSIHRSRFRYATTVFVDIIYLCIRKYAYIILMSYAVNNKYQ